MRILLVEDALDLAEATRSRLRKAGMACDHAPTLDEAYQIALNCVTREDLICITGSVYIVGLAKQLATAGKLA